MNRFSTGGADMLDEIRKVVPRIHDYNDYTRKFLLLSQEALARGETLKGGYYLRSAEFFMFSNDPRKQPSRLKFLQLWRESFGVKASDRISITYESGVLSVYRFTPPRIKDTIVMFGVSTATSRRRSRCCFTCATLDLMSSLSKGPDKDQPWRIRISQ